MEGEDPEQLEALLAELQTEFNPQSTEQRQLIAQLATQLWRLRRASRFESAVIEAYRAEHAQADPNYEAQYNAAFDQARDEAMRPFYNQLRQQFPHLTKTPLDRSPSEESVKPTPKKREVDRSDQDQPIKPDLSFVSQPSFQDALCNLARLEIQLTEELGRTLNLLVPKDGARIARAGFKHASSSEIAANYEDAGQFEHLRSEFQTDLKPQTATEWYLVDRIASLSWRLRRIPAFEVALLAAARANFEPATTQEPQWGI